MRSTRPSCVAVLAALCLLLGSCAHAPAPPPAGAGVVAPAAVSGERPTVFYATNRRPAGRLEPRRFFGREWGESVFGRALLQLPPREELARLERGRGRSLRSPGAPLKQVKLDALEPMPADSFFAAVAAAVGRSEQKRALVFLHGYNMPFERAVRFTAQLERGLGEGAVAIVYSWPASRNYHADEEAVEWTQRDLQAFLARLAAGIGAGSIDLLGYSMGTRALVRTLAALGSAAAVGPALADGATSPAGDPAPRFGQLVLAAPDLEARIFARSLPDVARAVRHVTLYCSSRDRALGMSRRMHGHARAGQAGPNLLLLPEMDTIDVSAVHSDLTGHGYLEELTGDLELLLGTSAPPDQRPGLTRATRGERSYWLMTRRQ